MARKDFEDARCSVIRAAVQAVLGLVRSSDDVPNRRAATTPNQLKLQ
jgi:hypothetical protein